MHRLDRSVEYVMDKEKTSRTGAGSAASSLEEAVDYARDREKTECGVFESAIGCTLETAYRDMRANKERWGQMDGVQGYHLVQSFAEGELTPELAHRIGLELAERLLHGQYPAVIATHLNTHCLHNHIVWDSVAMDTGRKYRSSAKTYYTGVRAESDRLCRQYGLSVLESPESEHGKKQSGKWMAEQNGKPTWRTAIRQDVDGAIAASLTWRQFVKALEGQGYELRMQRKYPTLKPPGKERCVRFKTLGKQYTPEAIRKLMKGPAEAEPVQEQPKLSREEYAAQKKAEREELWTRIDALTVDAFKDGSSLRGFLDFTAQCSPERIENLLLFHSDAPEVTWLKTFDEWKQAGRSVRGGEAGYTALIGQDYTREDGTAASGYYVGKKFDVSQTRGRQPDRAPVYAADELVTAVFTNSPVRLAVSEAVPEGIQAQYAAQNRTIYVRNNMDAQTTFLAIAREQAAASYDIHDGRFSRAAYSAQSYCAAYVAAKKYGLDVRSFSFDRVCQMCSGLEPQEQRRFLSDVKQAAYTVERTVRRGLNEMELSSTPEPACSVEVHASMEQTERPARTKKASQPQRE